jgi:hypothetical protein
MESIRTRLAECGLELHPEKTRIVYCKDKMRRKEYEQITFDFFGVYLQTAGRARPARWTLPELPAGDQRQGSN